MDVYARTSGNTTEIYTVRNSIGAIAVLSAALGVVAALTAVCAMWLVGFHPNAGIVGCVAGAVAGVATAYLGAPSRVQ